MKENVLIKKILLKMSDYVLFRNNVGVGYIGKIKYCAAKSSYVNIFLNRGDIILENPRRFTSGLGVGSSDLIGWHEVIITQEMVGKKIAVFTAVEAKTGKLTATEEQNRFISAIKNNGGEAYVFRESDL